MASNKQVNLPCIKLTPNIIKIREEGEKTIFGIKFKIFLASNIQDLKIIPPDFPYSIVRHLIFKQIKSFLDGKINNIINGKKYISSSDKTSDFSVDTFMVIPEYSKSEIKLKLEKSSKVSLKCPQDCTPDLNEKVVEEEIMKYIFDIKANLDSNDGSNHRDFDKIITEYLDYLKVSSKKFLKYCLNCESNYSLNRNHCQLFLELGELESFLVTITNPYISFSKLKEINNRYINSLINNKYKIHHKHEFYITDLTAQRLRLFPRITDMDSEIGKVTLESLLI